MNLFGATVATVATPTATPAAENGAGLWVTVSELARLRSVNKSTTSRQVDKLVEAGQLATKPGARGAKLVNLAAFEAALDQLGDAGKALAAETVKATAGLAAEAPAAAPATGGNAYRDAATRAKEYEADLKQIELDRQRGLLVPVADVTAAAIKCAETIVRTVDRLPTRYDDVAAAVTTEGPLGARRVLKEFARELRRELAEAMQSLATGSTAGAADDEEGGSDV